MPSDPNQEIETLNGRIKHLASQQEQAKSTLAVEEHKLHQLQDELKQMGYDVSEMTEEEVETLLSRLRADLDTGLNQLKSVLDQADKQIQEFTKFLGQHPS